jgi:4-diphosphocytidyl-2-C-methyl-D-erythritol kinase
MLHPGPVIARGRGEDVTPVALPPYRWALVTFRFGVSTGDAYAWWDQDGGETGPPVGPLVEGLAAEPGTLGRLLFNDLEPSVVRRHPEIGRAKELLLEGGAVGAVMSGSGPSVVGVVTDPEPWRDLWRALEEISGRPVSFVDS